jgi:hypothetical protein
VFSTDPNDPPCWPLGLTFDEQLRRLDLLAPHKAAAALVLMGECRCRQSATRMAGLALLVDEALRDEFWKLARMNRGERGRTKKKKGGAAL